MRFAIKLLLLCLWSSQILATGLRLPYSSAYLRHHPNSCGFVEFTSHGMMAMALNGQHVARWNFPEKGSPPHFRVVAEGEQKVLRDRTVIDEVKQALKDGSYEYEALDARIGGYYDGASRTYILAEGRHRMNAALEVAHETGDWRPFITLINYGRWDLGVTPKDAHSLHFRSHSTPIKEIYDTLDKITPPEFMPSQNALVRFFQGR